jgi:dihydrolipoamide dehydrogenase
MTHHQVDVAVIGAGTAGLAAWRAARRAGARALLIEAGALGTTCADHGCMPSKLLLAAANGVHQARHLGARGVLGTDGVHAHGAQVLEYVRSERDFFVAAVLDDMRDMPDGSLLRGRARFLSETQLAVSDEHGQEHRVQARSVVIATGAVPSVPPEFAVFGAHLLTSDTVFELNDLPRRLAVFGAGPIALELGQAMSRLGVQVRMFGRGGGAGGLGDPAVRGALVQALQQEFYFDPDAHIEAMALVGGLPSVRYRDRGGASVTAQFDAVLVATGRGPALQGLALERTGLSLDQAGTPRFDPATMQCGESAIFIGGDCDASRPWLSEAVDEGALAGANAARFPLVDRSARKAPLAIVFSEPQIVLVGTPYEALPPGGFVTGAASFEQQGRARVMRENRGLLHIYAERGSGRLLGAQGCGPVQEHLAHLLAWALQLELTVQQMARLPFYHPVVEEGLRTALHRAIAALAEPQR